MAGGYSLGEAVLGRQTAATPEEVRSQALTFRPDLQGLRAVAILLVVLAHAQVSLFAGGFVGVDVFFVLSGYLITGLLVREVSTTGRIDLLHFYARRLKRLLPALAVMIALTAGAAPFLLSHLEAPAQLASAPFAATWTSNLYFAFETIDYFDELAARDLFLHTWSLGVEEQFYLVWPLLMLGLFRLVTRRRQGTDARRMGYLALGLVLLASLLLSLYWSAVAPRSAFYLMPSRTWQFALGALAYLALEGDPWGEPNRFAKTRLSLLQSWAALGLGLTLITASAIGMHSGMTYPGLWALLPSLGAVLVLASGQALAGGRRGPLAHPALVWLGDRSYSWYLWHWPVLVLGISLGLDSPTQLLGLVLLSLLAAMLSYRLIEYPFWKGRLNRQPPTTTVLVGILIMSALVLGIYYQARSVAATPSPEVSFAKKWRIDIPIIYAMGCDAWYHHAHVEPCVIGPADGERTVVLLGDSIGAQWFSMVPAIFEKPVWRTVVLTKSACPMVDKDFFYERIGKVYEVCNEWRDAALAYVEALRPDVVFLGSASTYPFSPEEWIEGTERVLHRLSGAAGTIVIIPGTPALSFSGPGCALRHMTPDGQVNPTACTTGVRGSSADLVAGYLAHSARRFPNVRILNLNDLVCPKGVCNAVAADGSLIFRDSQHLNDDFVRSLLPAIQLRLKGVSSPKS